MKSNFTMNGIRRILPLFMTLWLCLGVTTGWGQTNPVAQTLPLNQNFGTTSFSSLPNGFVAWNDAGGVTTLTAAESSTVTGDAPFSARTSSTTAAGVYGLETAENGRVYIQTSSNTTNGRNQLALAVNTNGKQNIKLSFRISIELPPDADRAYGFVAQYRIGTSGVWTSIGSASAQYTNEAAGFSVDFSNLALGSDANNKPVVQIRWASWRSNTGSGSSGGFSIDNISVTAEDVPGPVIAAIPSTLTGFNYLKNYGPSNYQSFAVSGINLTNDINIDINGNYELSNDALGPYGNGPLVLPNVGGVVSSTLIFVQLASDLDEGNHPGSAIISSAGTLTQTVSLSGKVNVPLAIPYSNALRNTENRDDAIDEGFIFNIISVETGGGGYMRFGLNGYIESPVIDFTPFDQLQVQFDATTYGGSTGQVVASLISDDGGSAFDAIGVATLTTSYQTYTYIIDLTGIYNVPNGKLRFEMTDGTNSVRFRDLSITLVPVSTPTFDPPAGTFLSTVVPVNVEIETTTVGADLLYSTTSAAGPWITYTGSIPISESTTIWAYGVKDEMADSDVASAEYIIADVLAVSDIAELRSMYSAPATKANPVVYQLTNEVFLTLQSTFRSQKYIQDASGAILIDDADGNITTTYDLYDGITDIIGSLSMFNGMLQFVPISDPGPATSANTSAVVPVTVRTLSAITSADQAKLLKVLSISFDETGNFPAASSTNFAITDPSTPGTGVFRTQYFDPSFTYMGQPIPELPKHVTAVMNEYSGSFRLIARDLNDFSNTVIASIPPVGTFGVPFGTPEAAALATLPETTTIFDDGGAAWEVQVNWSIVSYNPELNTNFTAVGTFALPEGVDQSDPATDLIVQGIVAVSAPLPLSKYTLFAAMIAMLIAAGLLFRKRIARS